MFPVFVLPGPVVRRSGDVLKTNILCIPDLIPFLSVNLQNIKDSGSMLVKCTLKKMDS